jgi:hypothetical protein
MQNRTNFYIHTVYALDQNPYENAKSAAAQLQHLIPPIVEFASDLKMLLNCESKAYQLNIWPLNIKTRH